MRTFTHPLLSTLPCVLLIGKESKARTRFHRILRRAQFRTFVCAQLRDAVELMQFVSVVVCHQPLTDAHWKDVLQQAEKLRNAPSIVVTVPRPLTIDLEETNQARVFALLVPCPDAELISLIHRAHTEYQTVRQLQSAHSTERKSVDTFRIPTASTPSERQDSSEWTKSSSTAGFQAPKPPQRELNVDPVKTVNAN